MKLHDLREMYIFDDYVYETVVNNTSVKVFKNLKRGLYLVTLIGETAPDPIPGTIDTAAPLYVTAVEPQIHVYHGLFGEALPTPDVSPSVGEVAYAGYAISTENPAIVFKEKSDAPWQARLGSFSANGAAVEALLCFQLLRRVPL